MTHATSPKSASAPTPIDEHALVVVTVSTDVFANATGPVKATSLYSRETACEDVLVIAFATVCCARPGAKTSRPAVTVTGPVPRLSPRAAVTVGAPPAAFAWFETRSPPEKVLAAFSATLPVPVSARSPGPSTAPFSTTCTPDPATLTSVSSSSVVVPLKTVLPAAAYSAPSPSPPSHR